MVKKKDKSFQQLKKKHFNFWQVVLGNYLKLDCHLPNEIVSFATMKAL